MLSVRFEEVPLAPGTRSPEVLADWVLRTLGLVRHERDGLGEQPLRRLLLEHVVAEPTASHDPPSLADALGLSTAGLHHHLQRLAANRLLVNGGLEGSTRQWHVRFLDLRRAVDLMLEEAQTVLRLRLGELGSWWTAEGPRAAPEREPPALTLWVAEPHPGALEVTPMAAWMAALGLLGERPGPAREDGGIGARVLQRLLEDARPLSLDEGERALGASRGQIQRALDRLRAAGLVARHPREDRLPEALWSALQGQHVRRGADWLVKRGGLGLLPDEVAEALLAGLAGGSLDPEAIATCLTEVETPTQVLLLNRLGGRLAWGHQMAGDDAEAVTHHVLGRIERLAGRLRRAVATLVEVAGTDASA